MSSELRVSYVTANSREVMITALLNTKFETVNLIELCTHIGCPLLDDLLLQDKTHSVPDITIYKPLRLQHDTAFHKHPVFYIEEIRSVCKIFGALFCNVISSITAKIP
jgi:hypothetical protein